MRKLMFALVMMVTGAFAFGAGTPATAMTVSPVTGMSDVVKADSAIQKVYHWRRGFCWRHPYHWRCHHRGYRHRYYRRHYYRPHYRHYRRHHHHRRHWRY